MSGIEVFFVTALTIFLVLFIIDLIGQALFLSWLMRTLKESFTDDDEKK